MAARSIPVHLELRVDRLAPAEIGCAIHRGVDRELMAVQPYGVIGDPSRVIPRNARLNVMPCVLRPRARVAIGVALAHPVWPRAAGASFVGGVRPGIRPGVALHSRQYGLPVRHHLVDIEFQIGDITGRAGEIHPRIIEEMFRAGVVRERERIALPAVVGEIS